MNNELDFELKAIRESSLLTYFISISFRRRNINMFTPLHIEIKCNNFARVKYF